MDDLRRRFATLDDVPVPDIWTDVERRVVALGGPVPTERLTVVRAEWPGARDERQAGHRPTTRSRPTVTLLVAAALLAAALVGGALAFGSGLLRLSAVCPPPATASPAASPAPSRAAITPTPAVPPSPTPVDVVPADPTMFAVIRASRPVSDSVGWVATSSAIYRTTDRGATWSDVRPMTAASPAFAFVDADSMYVASGGASP